MCSFGDMKPTAGTLARAPHAVHILHARPHIGGGCAYGGVDPTVKIKVTTAAGCRRQRGRQRVLDSL